MFEVLSVIVSMAVLAASKGPNIIGSCVCLIRLVLVSLETFSIAMRNKASLLSKFSVHLENFMCKEIVSTKKLYID